LRGGRTHSNQRRGKDPPFAGEKNLMKGRPSGKFPFLRRTEMARGGECLRKEGEGEGRHVYRSAGKGRGGESRPRKPSLRRKESGSGRPGGVIGGRTNFAIRYCWGGEHIGEDSQKRRPFEGAKSDQGEERRKKKEGRKKASGIHLSLFLYEGRNSILLSLIPRRRFKKGEEF